MGGGYFVACVSLCYSLTTFWKLLRPENLVKIDSLKIYMINERYQILYRLVILVFLNQSFKCSNNGVMKCKLLHTLRREVLLQPIVPFPISQEYRHAVMIVEPKGLLKTTGSSQTTSHLRSLVSYVLSVSTDGPVTIVSK